jgi:DNA-directed RNA polymerase specialized sigma24 family protein
MSQGTPTSGSGLIPPQGNDGSTVARAFDGMDSVLDRVAAELYSFASMLVGEGEEAIRLVETAIATAEVSAASAAEARRSRRLALATAAVERIATRDSAALAAPQGLERAVTCIEDDDLDAAAEAREAMERMIAGPDRDRVRAWLESLPTAMRTIYALRAVAGLTASETSDILARHGGPRASGWTPEAVRELFRQALCSLASQLIHATAGQ